MFRPSKLRTHLLQAQDEGFSPDEILEGSGVRWADVESLQPLDLDTIARLFDYLARRTPSGFAIRAGYTSKVRNYGIVGFATMSMPTLRTAFEHWRRYYLVSGDPISTSISEHGDYWCMHFEPRCLMSAEATRFCIEASLGALEPVIAELTDVPAGTLGIDFASDHPWQDKHYRVFRTRNIRFDQKCTTYYGRRSDLDRPIPSGDAAVSDMLLRRCDEFMADLTNSRSICERLEDLMRASPGSIPSLDDMAATLGVSRRSIQRELQSEGIGYQQVVKQYRVRQAKLLLSEKRVNIKSVAYVLGFKDAGSFRRAFYSWTGTSAGAWQQQVASRRVRPAIAADARASVI
jgi:AraC-like DNA-binding protein